METSLILFLGLYGLGIVLLYKIIMLEKKIDSVKKSGGYDPVITIWKFFLQLLFGGASFVLIDFINKYLVSFQQLNTSIVIVILIAVFNAAANFIKNR